MSKHTPGPWTLHEEPARTFSDGSVDHGGFRVDAPNVEQLAYLWNASHRWGPDPQPFGASEAHANARLIHAAPDMLAALRDAERAVDELCVGQSPENECCLILGRIRAAIAKAEGETP